MWRKTAQRRSCRLIAAVSATRLLSVLTGAAESGLVSCHGVTNTISSVSRHQSWTVVTSNQTTSATMSPWEILAGNTHWDCSGRKCHRDLSASKLLMIRKYLNTTYQLRNKPDVYRYMWCENQFKKSKLNRTDVWWQISWSDPAYSAAQDAMYLLLSSGLPEVVVWWKINQMTAVAGWPWQVQEDHCLGTNTKFCWLLLGWRKQSDHFEGFY